MFELGAKYVLTFTDCENMKEELWNCKLIEYDKDNALIKVLQNGQEYIFNIRNQTFLEAKKQA